MLAASFSFDAFWDPLLFLLDGHELHLLDEPTRRDAEAVLAYVGRHEIDVIDVAPAFFGQLRTARSTQATGVRPAWPPLVILGGEQVSQADWDELAAAPGTVGYNFYGPTEATIDAVATSIEAQAPGHRQAAAEHPQLHT